MQQETSLPREARNGASIEIAEKSEVDKGASDWMANKEGSNAETGSVEKIAVPLSP